MRETIVQSNAQRLAIRTGTLSDGGRSFCCYGRIGIARVFASHKGISGTTLATGNFTFQIQVQDNIGARSFLTVNYKTSKPRPELKPETPQSRAAAANANHTHTGLCA
jgi:hypothetical protein